MKCVLCKNGETEDGVVTTTLQRGDTIVIVKEVPASICENCGEYYFSVEITDKLLKMAEDAVKKGIEVEILKFVA